MDIDIKTRAYSRDDKAYRLFPGASYRFFNAMRENSVVFLDYPGVGLPGPHGYPDDDSTLARIAVSEIKRKHRASAPTDILESYTENISSYADKSVQLAALFDPGDMRWTKRRRLALDWLNCLYHELGPGDVIVMPAPAYERADDGTWLRGRSLVGEIVGRAQNWRRPPMEFLGEQFVVRRVKWLAEFDELELERHVQSNLRTQNALVVLPVHAFETVVGAAYKNVVIDGWYHARFLTEESSFSAHECFHFTAFTMAVAAAYGRSLSGEGPFKKSMSIYDIAASLAAESDLVPEQHVRIHSPGYTTLKSRAIVPLVVSALFAMALDAEADPSKMPEPNQVMTINSTSPSFDPCDAGIDEAVRDSLRSIGFEQWKQLCEAARKASDQEGLRPVTDIRPNSDRR